MNTPTAPWLQITVTTTEPATVESLLEILGAQAVTLQDDANDTLIESHPGAHPVWRHTRVTGLFQADTDARAIQTALHSSAAPLRDYHADLIEDRDWVRAWLEDYQPMRFGNALWVCPHGQQVNAPGATVIHLDPGLAFGTGSHATTALCLEWLDAHPATNQRVLDYGCGSGILAVAAALQGASRITAVDTDPQALIATRDNAAANRVARTIDACPPDALGSGLGADLVLANILAGPLIGLAATMSTHVRHGGQLILSGILSDQEHAVMHAYADHFCLVSRNERDDWLCLELRRHA